MPFMGLVTLLTLQLKSPCCSLRTTCVNPPVLVGIRLQGNKAAVQGNKAFDPRIAVFPPPFFPLHPQLPDVPRPVLTAQRPRHPSRRVLPTIGLALPGKPRKHHPGKPRMDRATSPQSSPVGPAISPLPSEASRPGLRLALGPPSRPGCGPSTETAGGFVLAGGGGGPPSRSKSRTTRSSIPHPTGSRFPRVATRSRAAETQGTVHRFDRFFTRGVRPGTSPQMAAALATTPLELGRVRDGFPGGTRRRRRLGLRIAPR